MTSSPSFIGIDVSQATLDVAVRPAGAVWQVANDDASIAALAPQLRGLTPSLIVLEAAGGRPIILPVHPADPFKLALLHIRVRPVARSAPVAIPLEATVPPAQSRYGHEHGPVRYCNDN